MPLPPVTVQTTLNASQNPWDLAESKIPPYPDSPCSSPAPPGEVTLYFLLGGEGYSGPNGQTLGKYDAGLNQSHIEMERDDNLRRHRFLYSELKLK